MSHYYQLNGDTTMTHYDLSSGPTANPTAHPTIASLTAQQLRELLDYLWQERDIVAEGGWDGHNEYVSGICHTLRMFGLFSDADIDRWAVTPDPEREMLEAAMRLIDPSSAPR